MSFVYVLKNEDGKYYIGSTVNLNDRMHHHFGGYTPSTHRMGKLELVFSQEYRTLKQARYIEYRLKKFKRRDYIDRVVKDGYIKIMPR